MKLEIHDDAAAEIQSHYEWYKNRNASVAERLADLFEEAAVVSLGIHCGYR